MCLNSKSYLERDVLHSGRHYIRGNFRNYLHAATMVSVVVCFGYKSPLAPQYPDFQSCLVLKWTFNENLQLFRNHIIHFTPILEKAADGSKMEGSFPVGEIDKRHIGCRIKWSLVMHGFWKPGCRWPVVVRAH